MARRLSKNTLILLVSNVGSAILSFLIAVMIGRFYGEGGLGTYAGVLAWIFPLSFFVEFGFGTLITRDIAQDPDLASEYLRLTWQFRLLIGGFFIVVLYVFSTTISDDWLGLIVSSPLLIILPAYSAYTAIFRAHQRMQPIAWLNLGMLIIQVLLIGLAIIANYDLTWLFVINTVTSFGQLLSAHWIYRSRFYTKSKNKQKIRLIDLIRQARPFAFAGILSAVQARFSILWLETFSTSLVVGLFVASLRFIDGARMIPNALFGAVYPALSALSENRSAINRLFSRAMIGLALYGVIVAGVLGFFAEELLLFTFGENFVQASEILIIMGLGLVPFVLRSGWSLYWYALNRERAVNWILITNLILLISTSTGQWLMNPSNPLNIMATAILMTEILTVGIMFISEIFIWRNNTSSIASS